MSGRTIIALSLFPVIIQEICLQIVILAELWALVPAILTFIIAITPESFNLFLLVHLELFYILAGLSVVVVLLFIVATIVEILYPQIILVELPGVSPRLMLVGIFIIVIIRAHFPESVVKEYIATVVATL